MNRNAIYLTGDAGAKLKVARIVSAAAALAVASLILIGYQFLSLRESLRDDVEVQASIIADNIAASLMFSDTQNAVDMLRSFRNAPYLTGVAVYDRSGELFASYNREDSRHPPAQSSVPGAPLQTTSLEQVSVAMPVVYRRVMLGQVVLTASTAQIWTGLAHFAALLGMAAVTATMIGLLLIRRSRLRANLAEKELHYLAHIDPVTDLANRRASYDEAMRQLAAMRICGCRVAVMLLDLDNFKSINDTSGHAAGDVLLQEVARILLGSTRETDIVGRVGGDEFLIVAAPIVSREEATNLASRLTQALHKPLFIAGAEALVSASIGISVYPDDAENLTDLLRNADMALYRAKALGKNRFAEFHPAMTEAAQRRLTLENELRRALAEGHLDVYYQPQFSAGSRTLIGAEALVRWTHREHGAIPPSEFIPVAEESGLINEVGRYVLERACAAAATWCRSQDAPIGVSVNVSARQLREPGFLEDVAGALGRCGLEPHLLELELTESTLMTNIEAAITFMRAVRAMGVRLSIDDFGTGYSSLSYLQLFPIDQLKIDQSFVQQLPGGGETITQAIISLAHSFGLSVVAEGVETQQQLDWLRSMGCDYVQGYLLGRPLRHADFEALTYEARCGGTLDALRLNEPQQANACSVTTPGG